MLLFAQQLMLAHAVEHLAESSHQQGQSHDIACHDCLAFSHLPDGPSGSTFVPPLLSGAVSKAPPLQSLQARPAACGAYSIRAPPFLQ